MLRGSVCLVLAGGLAAACEDTESPEAARDASFFDPQSAVSGRVLLDASQATALDASTNAVLDGGFAWKLPRGFPPPVIPVDNPMTQEKATLGRHVFYDKRLSDNQTFACASCHKQELAFAEPLPVSKGSTGQDNTRGAMSLANAAYSPTLTWANPMQTTLEHQAQVPIFGTAPVELGITSADEVEARFRSVPKYRELFAAAFPGQQEPITMANVLNALATFERTLISGDSPYDRWQAGDESAVSDSAKRGHQLFNSEKLECFHCHGGFNFTDHVAWQEQAFASTPYHSTGLYNIDGLGGYPAPNRGVYELTMKGKDMGMFKAPTLRNIALTAPYMHDGSIATLSEVLDHYGKGGRAKSFRTDSLLVGFVLDDQERADVLAFLQSLTDNTFITNPDFGDPWNPARLGARDKSPAK